MDLHITSLRLTRRLSHYVHNWEHITQDRWVLQSITGYQLELTQTLHQAKQPQGISCSEEKHNKISQELTELLAKGAIVEAQLSLGRFISQWKRKGGAEASHKPEGPQQLCEDRALQDGRAPRLTRINPARGLDDQAGFKGHIPPGPKEYQCLLQFYWKQKTYQFVCLPFGLTSAPWMFTKIMKPLVGS